MMIPLAVLTLGALGAGYFQWPSHLFGRFLGNSPSFAATFEWLHTHGQHVGAVEYGRPAMGHQGEAFEWMMLASGLICIAGIALAYLMHLKDRARAERLAARYPNVTRLLEAKFWVDEIYQQGIVEPLRRLGRGLFAVDRFVVDGLVWLVGFVPQLSGFGLKLTAQRGSLQGYAALMLLSIAIILLVIFL